MDFGFSQQIWDSSIPWRTIGTNPYCPPEYFSHSDLNMSFDLFSLGVCLCVIFTGKYLYLPDCSKSPVSEESLNALTEEAKAVILSLTPENPEERISADIASQMPLFANVPDYILRLAQGNQEEDINSICESSSYSECNF